MKVFMDLQIKAFGNCYFVGNKEENMSDQNWSELIPEEKRQYKLDKYFSSEGIKFISANAEKAYKTRTMRLVNTYNVQEPDRVQVNMPVGNLPYLLKGLNTYDIMYNFRKVVESCIEFNEQYSEELEIFTLPNIISGKALELLDYKLYVWPGHGLPQGAPGFQFVEGEYMLADEYNSLIRDPSDFWTRTYLPRVFGAFKPFNTTRPVTDITEIIGTQQFSVLSNPDFQSMLQKMLDAGKEYGNAKEAMIGLSDLAISHGFPRNMRLFCKAPFDTIGDTMRGTQGIMTDMYRQPETLLKALDVIADVTIASILGSRNIKDTLFVFYPLHKGADGWMSQKQFDTFYWPSLRKVMNAFMHEGLIQQLFAEGSFNTRLEAINEFPKGFVSWRFDQTNMAMAKKILGSKCCIEGNVPSSLLITGFPTDVKEHCRRLIEICGKGGGYILGAGVTTENPKLENLRAMIEATREYGVYR
jgi:hypothetical protein